MAAPNRLLSTNTLISKGYAVQIGAVRGGTIVQGGTIDEASVAMNLLLLPLLTAAAALLTALMRRYALARGLLDVPGERTSHDGHTPRGGGVAIVATFFAALLLLSGEQVGTPLFWALLGGGGGAALVGFLDDHGHVNAGWRLAAHFACSLWALAWLGGLPPLPVFGTLLDLGWIGHGLGALYLVWMLNLYNFMDGIDGIASVEAITVCIGAAALCALSPAADSLCYPPLVLAAATAGFLVWNFPPARIFMGDAGSGFLGIAIAVLALDAAWRVPALAWGWLILLGVFIVDSTWTLLRRAVSGANVAQAHRSHGYQIAARRCGGHRGGHRPVTLAVAAINLGWLLPLALLVVTGRLDGIVGIAIAYAPLVGLAAKLGAGRTDA